MNKEARWLLDEKYGGVPSEEYEADVLRLEKGEPVDYVIGFSKFLGSRIDLSLRPLIPRTETEYWVEKALKNIKEHRGGEKLRILDVFSGSGCIGIAALAHLPEAHVDFADIEPNAIEQIRKNLALNNIDTTRYTIYASDVYAGIPYGKRYDIIFANPPYIGRNNISRIDSSVLDHEPHSALFAEGDGMELIERAIVGAKGLLASGGEIFIECDDIQYGAVCDLLQAQGFNYEFFKDQFGLWRFIIVKN